MSAPEPYKPRLTTPQAVLDAERLLELFHDESSLFAPAFFAATRDSFGAVLAYADLAIREAAIRANTTPAHLRLLLRQQVSATLAANERGDNDG